MHRNLVRSSTFLLLAIVAAAIVFGSPDTAQAQRKHKKKHDSGFKLSVDSTSHFVPSRTFGPGTVGKYFFPVKRGSSWTLRTMRVVLNDSGRIVRRDTAFSRETVVDTARYSLQGLPLVACRDLGYRSRSKDTTRSESFYYVDDSIAMTVFNNSVSHQLNKIFLVSPVEIGNHWHDQYGDSVLTVIAGVVDSVMTPIGRFDSVVVTLTRTSSTDLRKYFAAGYGIVKMIFRAPGPSGKGLVIVTTEMTECVRPDEATQPFIQNKQ